ncbi:MAG: hypothetical protein ACHQNV_06555 [Vicinamibacteria bacterium]
MPRGSWAAVVLAALASGCGSERPFVHLDLGRSLAAAVVHGGFRVILFGTPPAEPWQAWGFARPSSASGLDPYAWVYREARIHMNLPADKDRAVIVDIELPPGLTAQRARALLNDEEVGRFGLVARRKRYRVELPRANQERGLNELTLVFDRASPRVEVSGSRVAAALRSLVVGAAEDPALESLLAPEAPPALSLLEHGRGGVSCRRVRVI